MQYSIIVPIYNSEPFLKECLDSLIMQSYTNLEVILINDGSTDGSRKICENFKVKDNRFKLINQENLGVSEARNRGILEATGDFVLFIDSDDILIPGALETINQILLTNSNTDLLIYELTSNLSTHENYFKNIQGSYSINEFTKKHLSNFIKKEYINSPIKVYNNKILRDSTIIFDNTINIGEDLLFNIKFLFCCTNIYILDKPLYQYINRSNNSLSRKFNENKYFELEAVRFKILKAISQTKFSNLQKAKLTDAIYYIKVKNIYSTFKDLFNPGCLYSWHEKKNFVREIQNKTGKLKINNLDNILLKFFALSYNLNNPTLLLFLLKILLKNKK